MEKQTKKAIENKGYNRTGSLPVLLILLGAVGVFAVTGRGVPCVFYLVTGWKCPGCGITTLVMCLLRGNVAAAYGANPFLFLTLPFLGVYLLVYALRSHQKKSGILLEKVIPVAYLVCLIFYGIFRNQIV